MNAIVADYLNDRTKKHLDSLNRKATGEMLAFSSFWDRDGFAYGEWRSKHTASEQFVGIPAPLSESF